MAKPLTQTFEVNYEVDGIEVEIIEDCYGEHHFFDAKIGPFSIYTTKEQRDAMLELALKQMAAERQDNLHDMQVFNAQVRGEI